MWQTDTVYLQTVVETNVDGSISQEWTNGVSVSCDVQHINKEYVYKAYGLTEIGEYSQIYDHTEANWIVGDQVSINSEQWLVVLVNGNMSKMGASNHKAIIVRKVVE